MSVFRPALEGSSSPIACNACDLSIMRFIRAISTEMNAATAPRRNEGAVTWAMTWDSCVTEGVSTAMCVDSDVGADVPVRRLRATADVAPPHPAERRSSLLTRPSVQPSLFQSAPQRPLFYGARRVNRIGDMGDLLCQ